MSPILVSPQTEKSPQRDHFILWFMIAIHALAVGAFFTFRWDSLLVFLFMYLLTTISITLGYHRLLTHRSFKAPQWFERFIATTATIALQGGPLEWVSHHRMHHAHTDTDGDPHNARRGFWYAHMNWLFRKVEKFDSPEVQRRFARDIAKDPYLMWLQTPVAQIGIQVIVGLILLALGGWSYVFWGVFLRLVCAYHATWFVNSACHFWGYRTYETDELSRNNWWVAILTSGEGWHNNHHAQQDVAPSKRFWYEVDVTFMVIRLLEKLGIAYAIKMPPPLVVESKEASKAVNA